MYEYTCVYLRSLHETPKIYRPCLKQEGQYMHDGDPTENNHRVQEIDLRNEDEDTGKVENGEGPCIQSLSCLLPFVKLYTLHCFAIHGQSHCSQISVFKYLSRSVLFFYSFNIFFLSLSFQVFIFYKPYDNTNMQKR